MTLLIIMLAAIVLGCALHGVWTVRRHDVSTGKRGERRSVEAMAWMTIAGCLASAGALASQRDLAHRGAAYGAMAATCFALVVLWLTAGHRLRARVSGHRATTMDLAMAVARSTILQFYGLMAAVGVTASVVVVAAAEVPATRGLPSGVLFVAASLLGVGVAFVTYPLAIKALFRATPLDRPGMRERLATLERTSGYAIDGVFRMPSNDGRANAVVAGLLPKRRLIFVNDMLLETFPDDEIVAVVAHELGHIAHRHLAGRFAVHAASIVVLAAILRGLTRWTQALTVERGLLVPIAFSIIYTLLYVVIVQLPHMRADEKQADRRAAEWVGADLIARALRRLHEFNEHVEDGSTIERVFATHPSLNERLRSMELLDRR